MNRPLLNKAFAVGLLVAVWGVAFLVAFTFFRKGGYSEKDTYLVYTYYEDATGLTWKSRVQIAGIQVGEVERITLDQARARSLRDLPEQEREVKCALESTSVAKLLDSMAKISSDVQNVTRELNEMVAGSQGSIRQIVKNLEEVSARINDSVSEGQDKIAAILDNTQSFTGTLADVAGADRQRYHNIAKNIEQASSRLDQVLKSVQDLVGSDADEGTKQAVSDARTSLRRLNNSLEQVEKVAKNIGEGKGVAGKLLNDERLGEKLSGTIETVSDYVDRLNKLQIQVNID